MMFCLVLIPSIFSIEVTNESREYVRYRKEVSNFTDEFLYFDNFDGKNFFVQFLVIPQLRVYGTPDTLSIWNPTLYFQRGSEIISVDTTACWGWWNNASSDWEKRQNEDCPTVSFEMKSNDKDMTIYLRTNGTLKPSPQFITYYYGYSTAYADDRILYSDTRRIASNSLTEFFTLNLNLWKGAYYLLIVVIMVVGVLFFIGGIPLLIKKIIVKVSGR